MKKIFLGLTVLASSLSFAQQFGVKAGLNLSDISNTSTAVDTKMKTGLYAGVTATFPITESYSIKPELVYNQMGAKTDLYDFGGIIGQVSTTTKLDYLSLPIMLQYNLPSNLYLEVGPEFSYMLSANQSLNTIITPSTNNQSFVGSERPTMKLLLNGSFGSSFQELWGCRKIFK